jgi:hypothetical protein
MKPLSFTLRIAVLALLLGIFFILAAQLAGVADAAASASSGARAAAADSSAAPGGFLVPFALFCLTVSLVMSWLTLRSRWFGSKLILVLALAMYGVMTVATQVETLFFLRDKMPVALILRLFVQGAITTALFVPVLVALMGKLRQPQGMTAVSSVPLRPSALAERLAITIVLFVFLYMLFGYFVAWRNPVLRQFYGGADAPNFFISLENNWHTTPGVYVLQVFRAILYFACALPLVRMLRAPKWEALLAIAAFLSVWSLALLLPNPIMPRTVAMSHFWETVMCFLVFGAVLGWMLSDRQRPASLANIAS